MTEALVPGGAHVLNIERFGARVAPAKKPRIASKSITLQKSTSLIKKIKNKQVVFKRTSNETTYDLTLGTFDSA